MKKHFEQDILDNLKPFTYEMYVLDSGDSCEYICDTRFGEYNDKKIYIDIFVI